MDYKKDHDMFRIEWNDRPVVRVLGIVMTRDDTLGGWVHYANGGQSKIGIYESMDKRRYRIYGWRMSDKKVTLDCLIQRNMVFHETIGTFHHWQVGDHKMGLTFYTPAEARSFNRGVRFALEQLSRIPDYASSSASSMCSRASDEHHSSCTSPASSTGSSSPCENGSFSARRTPLDTHKKHSTSSASSTSSSRRGTRRGISPGPKPGRPVRTVHNSSSSSTSIKNRSLTRQPVVSSTAPTLSLLSSASPRYCDTPSSCDLGQSHFRWPLPQQQGYQANLTFLNRHLHQDGSSYEASSFTLPTHAQTGACREGDVVALPKPQMPVPDNTEPDAAKTPESGSLSGDRPVETQPSRARGRDDRRVQPAHGRQRSQHHHHQRSRHTKTPHLDDLERRRDLKPTEPNSYVFFSSSKPSQRLDRGTASEMTAALTTIRSGNYKPLALIDQYHPILSTRRGCPPYQPPQSGTLSIMASNDTSAFYSRSDMYYTSHIDSIKYDAIRCEPGNSLLSSPKKSRHKADYGSADDGGGSCCCPRLSAKRKPRKHKDDLAERSRCRHCQEVFNHERNRPGSCREAPDPCLRNIDRATCMCCVHSVFYHCCRDDEGDYDADPCSCGRGNSARRWAALAALSLICPCLCLYPPLKACHGCGVACRACGGRHEAQFSAGRNDGSKQKRGRR